MDTGSHLLFGATLAGVAQLHPAVHGDPGLSAAVLCAALIGSNAPDLDAVCRLKGTDVYVKHHRGWSHSIPALLLWPSAIGPLTAWAFGVTPHAFLLALWAAIAVFLHVALDWTNAYGVRCLLPFRREWLHLDSLCLTDPYLIVLHATAAAGWAAGWWGHPGAVCLAAWAATALYAGWRIAHHGIAVRRVKRRYRRWQAVHVLPDPLWHRWHYVVQTEHRYLMGQIVGRRLLPMGELPRADAEGHDYVRISRGAANVKALLQFAKRAYVKWQAQPDGGYLVIWTDLRFWQERHWPFRAEVRLDGQFNVIEQTLGWHKKAWEPPYV
ncbi:metal-dependent hydrolase [Cohnella thermotolerans]|uniref:metal-dependent hydrolase n=1 Tax=Cohnella thermotolerans TaxID=329858 RepID=UPI0003F6A896|nr:metal-dependent hydrolase [Cohnella thermotolerans]